MSADPFAETEDRGPRWPEVRAWLQTHPDLLAEDRALLEELGQPLLGTTLIMPDDDGPLNDPDEVRNRLERLIELVIDGGACHLEPTTVIDLTGSEPELLRQGRGDAGLFGL